MHSHLESAPHVMILVKDEDRTGDGAPGYMLRTKVIIALPTYNDDVLDLLRVCPIGASVQCLCPDLTAQPGVGRQ